jgi:DHA1 family multidrug resistance protein-like MFS transporter
MGAGLVLGPGLGGLLASHSLATPFFVASGLCLVSLLLVWFLLPESLPAEKRRSDGGKPAGLQIGVIRQVLTGPLGILMLLIFVVSFGMSSFQGILGLFALDKFGFDARQIGVIWMVVGGLVIVGQGILTGPLTKRFGEVTVIRFSLLATVAGFGLIPLAKAYLPLLVATGFLVLAIALLGPALNALISTRTTIQQGLTMGVNNSFSGLGKVLGPLWAGFIFDVHLDLPFLSSAVILLLGFFISLIWVAQTPPAPRQAEHFKAV